MMIEQITTKFDEKTKDDTTKKVKTILGKSDPNQIRHKVFIGTDPRVWDVVYLQLANAGVSQEIINEVYDDVRGGTPNLKPNPIALHLLARYKLTGLNSTDDTDSVLETLSDAFDVIGNHGEFPHNPSLETLEDVNPDAFQALGILSLFVPSIFQAIQSTDTDNNNRLLAAATMARKCVNAEVPLTDDNIKQIVGALTGEMEVSSGAEIPRKKASTPVGLPPISNYSSDVDFDLSDITPKSRKTKKDKIVEEKPVKVPAAPAPEPNLTVSATEVPKAASVATTPDVPKAAPAASATDVTKSAPTTSTPSALAPVTLEPTTPNPEPATTVPKVAPSEPVESDPVVTKSDLAAPDSEVPMEPTIGTDLSGIVIDEPEPEEISVNETPAVDETPASSVDMTDGMGKDALPPEPKKRSVTETPTVKETPESGNDIADGMDKDALPPGALTTPVHHINIPKSVIMEISNHASSRDQITDAIRHVERDIMENTPNAQFLAHYVPGVTQEIIKDILLNRTASGRYINRSTGRDGDAIPHTSLTGGSTYTYTNRNRTIGPVEVPLGFAQEKSSVLWDNPVITTMGYPFINFGAPEIYTILKDKDEKRVKQAYKKLKKQLKKVGLSDPIKVLKDFKNSAGVPCAINRLSIDSNDLLETGNTTVIATVYPRASSTMQAAIGSIPITRDFIAEMYKLLSPTKGAKVYMDTLGMSDEEYAEVLNTEGRPPIYIFIPKEKLQFKQAPAGFIARLFTSDKKPTLVEAKIGTHSGGFVMPFKTARILFTMI